MAQRSFDSYAAEPFHLSTPSPVEIQQQQQQQPIQETFPSICFNMTSLLYVGIYDFAQMYVYM